MPLVRDEGRALATVETITAIRPIEGADAIEAAQVRGWTIVIRKGEFIVGDRVVYFEIDTALPLEDDRFEFLAARGSKDVDGHPFHVLKTARLRGTYSQGLVLPLGQFLREIRTWQQETLAAAGIGTCPDRVPNGMDVTEALDLSKWEPALPTGGQQAGPFLTRYAEKTDSERVQNLDEVWPAIMQHPWVATEKVDGTSCTIICDEDGTLRVCGRNWEIADGDNLYWRTARCLDLADMEPGDVVQAEVAGLGVQGNRLGLLSVRPVVFGYAHNRRHLPRDQWPQWALDQAAPIHDLTFPASPAEAVAQVDGLKSLVSPGRLAEGIVWHTADGSVVPELGRSTWKAISNRYLAKG